MEFLVTLSKLAWRLFEFVAYFLGCLVIGFIFGCLVLWVLDLLFIEQFQPFGVILSLSLGGFFIGGKLEQRFE
jgi:fructose-specific phosphotransferase system IIC component